MIKSFQDRLNEASLSGNPGIPGEGEGDERKKYLPDVERRAEERNAQLQRTHGRDIPQFMSLVSKARSLQKGKEAELEALAERAIRTMYGDILNDVELRIKFPKSADQMKKSMENVPAEPPEMPQLKVLQDAGIISEIHKRKIANNITQGEAKNTKKMLNLPEVRDGLYQILGREAGMEYLVALNKITEIAGFFDWMIPMEVQLEMWERDKSGFSGSVSVEWETPEENKDSEDLAQQILDELMDDSELPEEEAEELFDSVKPTINALGTDFSMLLHETVKGIYELIASCGIPQDEESAQIVIDNTDTLADEIEDLRYGPEIAGDLRDFINKFPESRDITNLREHIFGKMMLMPADDFLKLMLMILSEDPKAKDEVQEIIDEITQELKDYDMAMSGIDSDDYKEYPISPEEPEEPEGEPDYANMSKKEINDLIDAAIDIRDFDKVEQLAKYIKESKQKDLYERVNKIEGLRFRDSSH
jgi:hypothetical protein